MNDHHISYNINDHILNIRHYEIIFDNSEKIFLNKKYEYMI